jgi:arylsulfatase A
VLGVVWRCRAWLDKVPPIAFHDEQLMRFCKTSICLLTVIVAISSPAAEKASKPPNILLISADNLGYGDLGCYGNKEIKTPNLDQLAREGVLCTDFYVAAASCTPSRASLLTGRHPERNGLNRQLGGKENLEGVGLRHSEKLLPQFLKPAGYATACFGKWNIGFAKGSRPTERGFDEYFGNASGNINYYTHVYGHRNDLFRGTESVQVAGYSTDLFAEAAMDFMRRKKAQPFFIYLPFNAPHFNSSGNMAPGEKPIWQAPDDFFKVYGMSPDERNEKKRYYAVVTALDAAIGRVLKELDALGLRDNTLVMFHSDNGAFMLKGRGLEVASNRPLREGGVTLYEGGIRVPCLVRWPGQIKPDTVCREPLVHVDFLATSLRAAGVAVPSDRVIDGRDAIPTLAGKARSPHKSFCWIWEKWQALRNGKYKLVRNGKEHAWQLYDLSKDIGEANDLAAGEPKLVAKLDREFAKWFAEVHSN